MPLEEYQDQDAQLMRISMPMKRSGRILFGSLLLAAIVGWLTGRALGQEAGPNLTNSVGMRLVRIPAGEFVMGSLDGEEDERPAQRVVISRPFYLGAFEVAQGEYQRVMGSNPSWFSAEGPGARSVAGQDASHLPVDMVSWEDAAEFCRRLSDLPAEREGGRVYRLPTEAEWEYACRAAATSSFSTGDALAATQATIQSSGVRLAPEQGMPRPVGSFAPNNFGLYDMHGNVWEWCADWYAADTYRYRPTPAIDPRGPPTGTGRVVRGGDWHFDARACRSANRDFTRATRRDLGNGFRVALDF
jgi:formylglycine-generating enzyme required for sulfatase activity